MKTEFKGMNSIFRRASALLLALMLLFSVTACSKAPAENESKPTGTSQTQSTASTPVEIDVTKPAEPITLDSIPAFSGESYVKINNNVPYFSKAELAMSATEKYSELDSLGRCGVAFAICGKEIMPAADEQRGDISSIKPTGWKQKQYDCVPTSYLYNRSHLIGWQLSAENANNKNLITGTQYMNQTGMKQFENMVADYIKETGNHVAYRVTPMFKGNNLLCNGVQIEAYSIEDKGEGICFNVFCYNVQEGVTIDYATGNSSGEGEEAPTAPSPNTVAYITKTGKKYHSKKDCQYLANAKAIFDSTVSEAEGKKLEPCSKCW